MLPLKTTIKQTTRLVILLALISAMGGCTTSKSLSKKAEKLEEAGLYSDAALFYYNALIKNRNNVNARIGLSKMGQRLLNNKIDKFTKTRALGEDKEAVYAYLDAKEYLEKINRLGIELEYPRYIDEDYEDVKEAYVKELYDESNDLLADKKFDQASSLLKEIERLSPGYKDVSSLKNTAVNEPLYLDALQHFDAGRYRLAYYEFDEVYSIDPNYKDAAILKEECLDLGKFPVAISKLENGTKFSQVDERLSAFIVTGLSSINDPFLRIVERDNLDLILKEQKMSLSGIVDQNTAVEVGSLLGAKAIITGKVISFSEKRGKLKVTQKNGYEGYQVKLMNKETGKNYYQTRYKPVTYKEYYNANEVNISFQYKAISLETGEVLFSEIAEKKVSDEVYYASYEGEAMNLFPASKEGVLSGKMDKKRLLDMLRADRNLHSTEELANNAYTKIATDLSSEIKNLLRE
ncbi:MAG: CsgG/HfaB family protein [Flavobacteriales bacterium]|nr:CsgG/HfaB family protein [Flavobacteriales bacterium]